MIYTIEEFKMFDSGTDFNETVFVTTDDEEMWNYFDKMCGVTNMKEYKHFVEYNVYEWGKPDLKILLDTWNNGYKIKRE